MNAAAAVGAAPSAWSWRVSARPWFAMQAVRLSRWMPDASLGLSEALRRRVREAASREEPWIYHPLLCAVTFDQSDKGRDLRLAVWAAANSDNDESLGDVVFDAPCWIWGRDGGVLIESGQYSLRSLAERVRPSDDHKRIVDLDPWIDCVGLPLPAGIVDYEGWSWAHRQPLTADDERRLRHGIVGFLVSGAMLAERLPQCAEWVSGIVRVVVPLHSAGGNRFRSGSSAALPGLVFTDINGPTEQLLETLVHESAHHWLCLAEAEGPLVDPAHAQTYTSPLRADPRPLRGIFLAFHALAFMTAFYRDWFEAVDVGKKRAAFDSVRKLRDDAQATLNAGRHALTDHGRAMFDLTIRNVVAYAS